MTHVISESVISALRPRPLLSCRADSMPPALCPFKVSYYCEKRDPDFDSKMHDVLVIYKQVSLQFDETGNLKPFEGVPVHTFFFA